MSDAVHRSILVPAAPEAVWDALTQPDQLRAWFGADVELAPRPGGDVRAAWPDGSRSVGSVERADHPHRLVLRWRRIDGVGFASRVGGATRVVFDLREAPAGTELSVSEEPVELVGVVAP
jgi:uncharacterized protein YndB with AHSA1/START domain